MLQEKLKSLSLETVYYDIANNAGYELPSTGGPGDAIFRLSGLSLISLAVLAMLSLSRKRRVRG